MVWLAAGGHSGGETETVKGSGSGGQKDRQKVLRR